MNGKALLIGFMIAVCAGAAAQTEAPLDAGKAFAYDAGKPLNYQEGKSDNLSGVRVVEISYDSPKIGRVPGYLVIPPPGKARFAGIVFMHWGQGNKGEFLSEAIDLAARSLAVGIMIDAPYWRPDVPPPSPENKYEAEHEQYVQMVVDLRRAVDVLVARKDVDPARIGYVGHSLGATWGAPLAAVEKRVKVLVLMGGLSKVPPDWDDQSFYAEVGRASTKRENFDKEVAAMRPYQPENFAANTGPAKIYFQWARYDMYISRRSADEYFNAVGGPKEQRWYNTSHEFNDTASHTDRMTWLTQALNLH